jgi:hypothetical protein
MWPAGARWAPIGTRITAWQWLGVPDKYGTPRGFDDYDRAAEYAAANAGRVEIEYEVRSPQGATWQLRLTIPEAHERDRAVGCEVVGRSYRAGLSHEEAPVFPTPEEATEHVRQGNGWIVQENLRFRTADGDEFEVTGALNY